MDVDFILGAELTRRYGSRKAGVILADVNVAKIEEKLGRFAALLWLLVNEREWVARYGQKGQHLLTAEMLSDETGWDIRKVEATLLALLCNGCLRMSGDNAVRAA
jgi:hypothetical protein